MQVSSMHFYLQLKFVDYVDLLESLFVVAANEKDRMLELVQELRDMSLNQSMS